MKIQEDAFEQPNYESSLSNLSDQLLEIQKDVGSLKKAEQPDYEGQFTELSKQVSGIQEVNEELVTALNKPKPPVLKPDFAGMEAELEERKDASDSLEELLGNREDILENRELRVTSDEQSVKLARLSGRLYWLIGGVTLAGAAVYGEYTGITDLVDLTDWRG